MTTDDDNDTDESESATYTITITVPCPEGCTLTQGYWKTHNESFHGGAPADDTWWLLGDADGDGVGGEGEEFFLSGLTYFEAMWTAPQGNVYFNLTHQYIAAQLNMLDGAVARRAGPHSMRPRPVPDLHPGGDRRTEGQERQGAASGVHLPGRHPRLVQRGPSVPATATRSALLVHRGRPAPVADPRARRSIG